MTNDATSLGKIAGLRSIQMGHTQVTDRGLAYLSSSVHLRGLGLIGTQTTDAGLNHLKHFASLRSIGLLGTRVTTEGVRKLKEALPECDIDSSVEGTMFPECFGAEPLSRSEITPTGRLEP